MNSYEYIEEAKKNAGFETDYMLSKALGWSRQKISNYKNGQLMDNDSARQIAEVLDIPVFAIIADMEAQRAKDEATKSKWIELAKMTAQRGIASTNLLLLLSFFSWAVQKCILC